MQGVFVKFQRFLSRREEVFSFRDGVEQKRVEFGRFLSLRFEINSRLSNLVHNYVL